jgi:uncharacterized phage protein gp47/JayE
MTDTWIDADENVIRDDIVEIAKEETGLTNFKSVGVLRGFIEALARVVFFIYRTAINPIYANATLDGATGSWLDCWGLLLGVVRKRAAKAAGRFTASAYGDGSVPAGAWVVIDGAELRYKVTAKIAFTAGETFALPVEAEFAGSGYNIEPGTNVRITRVVPGLDAASVGENWLAVTGDDAETDDAYRARIQNRWRSQSLGDTAATYKYYAESVPGVREAKVARAPRGPGSSDVVIAAANGIPDDDLLTAVESALSERKLMGFDVRVRAPETASVDVVIEYAGDAPAAAVRMTAERYVHGIGIGGRLSVRDLYKALEPLALVSCEILSPDRDAQAAPTQIAVAIVTVTRLNHE